MHLRSAMGAMTLLAAAGLALLPTIAAAAEPGAAVDATEDKLSKEDLLHRLKTRQAQLQLDQAETKRRRAKADFEETQRLFDEKILTIDKLNEARQDWEEAELKYKEAAIELEKTRLEFLKDATFITVVDAMKYRNETTGQIMASIQLRNDSDIGKARVVMGDAAELGEDTLRALLKVDNVVVTLREQGGAIIGDPFQHIIPKLEFGAEATREYVLLKRDVDEVTVVMEFLGTEKQYTVFLKKKALQDVPTIVSTQYAQEGPLGTKISYDLKLERLAKTEQSFSLFVLNLPTALASAFLDPKSGARITQVRFTSEASQQNLDFEVSIPERLDQSFVDKSISFTIVLPRNPEEMYELKKRYRDKRVPDEEIAKIKGARADLILIPRGVGKLDIVVGNLFKEVKQGEPVTFKFNIMNSGTLALRRVMPEIDPPMEWEATLTPEEVEAIEPGRKILITAELTPPQGVGVSEYITRIGAKAHSGIEIIEADEKEFAVRIAAKSNIGGTLILVLVLIVLVLGIAVASIKISRR